MPLTFEKPALVRALKPVRDVLPRTVIVEAAKFARLRPTGPDTIDITGTNFEQHVTVTATGLVDNESDDMLIDAQTLLGIAQAAPDGAQIELSRGAGTQGDPNGIKARAGGAQWSVPTLTDDDGTLDLFDAWHVDAEPFDIDAEPLNRAGQLTAPYISTEPARYFLNGVYLDQIDGGLTLTGINGAQLTSVAIPGAEIPQGALPDPAPIVPAPVWAVLAKTLAGASIGTVQIACDARLIRLTMGPVVLTSKMIDAKQTDWRKLIPTCDAGIATIDNATLRSVLTRANTLRSANTRAAKLTPDGDTLTVQTRTPESGTFTETIPAAVEGSCVPRAFNTDLLCPWLDLLPSGDVTLKFSQEQANGILIGHVDLDTVLHVLFPVTITW